MIVKLQLVRYMLVSDVTAQYLTFTNNELHLSEDVGSLKKQQNRELDDSYLDYVVTEHSYPLSWIISP